jgi:hypothetical protein
MTLRRNPSHISPRLGGMVTVTPIRDHLVEHEAAFSITWHSPRGDLRWLSGRIPSQESVDAAAGYSLASLDQYWLADKGNRAGKIAVAGAGQTAADEFLRGGTVVTAVQLPFRPHRVSPGDFFLRGKFSRKSNIAKIQQ